MTAETVPIESVLDRCLIAIREKNYFIEDCLAKYPEKKDELEPLLFLALRLQSARTVEPELDYRRDASSQIVDLIKSQPRPSKWRAKARLAELTGNPTKSPTRHTRSSIIILLGIILFIGIVLASFIGVAISASHALPGSIFYPVKPMVEMTQLAFSWDTYHDARLYLKYSEQRLIETDILLNKQQFGEAKYSLVDYQLAIQQTVDNLSERSALTADQQNTLAQLVVDQCSQNHLYLLLLAQDAPEMVQPGIELADELTEQLLTLSRTRLGEIP